MLSTAGRLDERWSKTSARQAAGNVAASVAAVISSQVTMLSFELATVIIKHGGDLPSDWISFASGRDFIDLVNFGMFVTVEYATGM